MTNRVHIDALAGIIDIEGEKDFVEGLLSKLFPLIEKTGFGKLAPHQADQRETSAGSVESPTVDNEQEQAKQKIKRRRGAATPKGQSCSDRILTLKADGFFKNHRSATEIVEELGVKGWTHKSNQVAAATGKLFSRGLIQRTKDGPKSFKYFWDRG